MAESNKLCKKCEANNIYLYTNLFTVTLVFKGNTIYLYSIANDNLGKLQS